MSNAFGTYRVVSHAKPAATFERPGGELILRFPTRDRGLETLAIRELGENIAENFVPTGLEPIAKSMTGSAARIMLLSTPALLRGLADE